MVGSQKIEWKQGDTFCVPSWYEYTHHAGNEKTVYLYKSHDKPMLKSLGFYRLDGDDTETLVST